jgi:alkanesulfonate monooxygenase SsuD/methylene tetrahydromethanopterin reductase-like flavin-dependent oxidoreductase (luciferase family)
MARVGYALGYGKFTNVREMADVMRQAEERGFEMAFFGDRRADARFQLVRSPRWLATKNSSGFTQIVRLRGQ